jgi:hypothetical protein
MRVATRSLVLTVLLALPAGLCGDVIESIGGKGLPAADHSAVKQHPKPSPQSRPLPEPTFQGQSVAGPKPQSQAGQQAASQAKPAAGPRRVRLPPRAVLSPLEMVALIAGKTSDFGLDVTVDRFDGGLYEVGDELKVRVTSELAGYLYLLYVDSRGIVSPLYPQPG